MFVESKLKGVQRPAYEAKCRRDGKMFTVYMIAYVYVSTVVVFTFESKTSKPSFDIRRYRKCDSGSEERSSCSRLWYSP